MPVEQMSTATIIDGDELSVSVAIDRDLPPVWVDEYIDPKTGETVPGHYWDRSHLVQLVAETRDCGCGMTHGVTVEGSKDMFDHPGWPEMRQAYLDATVNAVVNAVEKCREARR